MAVHCQRDVVHGSRAEAPASGGTVGVVLEDQSLSRTAGAHFEAVKLAFLAGLAEAQSFGEEALAFGHFAHGKHGAVKAAHRFAGADLFGDPTLARIVGRVFENFKR